MAEGQEELNKILGEISNRLDTLESRLNVIEKTNNQVSSTTVKNTVINPTLVSYLEENWNKASKESLNSNLIVKGWKEPDIQAAFQDVESRKGQFIDSTQAITDTEKPIVQEKKNFEVELGQKWFSRFGIAALVVGVALFLIYTLQYFGPAGKSAVGILSSLALIGLGYWLEKKYAVFGKILFGGGVATLYFTIYAMHYFEASKVIGNQYVDIVLLAIVSIGYFAYMLRYKNENLAIYPLSLIFLTVNLGSLEKFSLIMVVIFMAAVLGIFVKSAWKTGFIVTIFLAYATLGRWLLPNLDSFGGYDSGIFLFSISILTIFFIFFSLAHYLIFEKITDKEQEDFVLTALNGGLFSIFFLTICWSNFVDDKGYLALILSVLFLMLAVVARFISQKIYRARTYLGFTVFFLMIFIPNCFEHEMVTLGYLLVGLIFMGYGILKGTIRTRAIGLAILIFSFISVFSYSYIKDKDTIVYLMFLAFGLLFEGISFLLSKYNLQKLETDKPENETAIKATLSVISVVSLALFAFFAFDYKYLSLAWGVIGFVVPLLGFVFNDKYFRRAGLILLLIVLFKLFFIDLAGLETIYRIVSFIILGVILLTISFGYTKYKDKIERYL